VLGQSGEIFGFAGVFHDVVKLFSLMPQNVLSEPQIWLCRPVRITERLALHDGVVQ
jgi:hypothetical protein